MEARELTQIDDQLREEIPYLLRRECTPRVMFVIDALLDERNETLGLADLKDL